jgi:hypothetical protein
MLIAWCLAWIKEAILAVQRAFLRKGRAPTAKIRVFLFRLWQFKTNQDHS